MSNYSGHMFCFQTEMNEQILVGKSFSSAAWCCWVQPMCWCVLAVSNLNLGRLQYRDITDNPDVTVERLTGLNPNTTYRVYLRAATSVGTGEPIFVDATTELSGRKLCTAHLTPCCFCVNFDSRLAERTSVFTARRSYASAVLGVVILSVRLSHACFVTNAKNLPAIFLYHMKGQSF